jgi:hypothetical protein
MTSLVGLDRIGSVESSTRADWERLSTLVRAGFKTLPQQLSVGKAFA